MPKFSIGRLVATPGAVELLKEARVNPRTLLKRHMKGDWGNLCDFDKEQNDIALKTDARLMSSYDIQGGTVWIITEWNRSVTTILLPEDY